MRNACLWAVLTASLSLAQSYKSSHCDADSESKPAWMTTNAVVLWNAVADNSIAVVAGKPPQLGSVDAAIVHTAVYDAVNAVCGYPFAPYGAVRPNVRVPAS